MPFAAEDIYQRIQNGNLKIENYNAKLKNIKSVHLEDWLSELRTKDKGLKILQDMAEVRRIVSLGLEARAKAGIKVRQPLAMFRIVNQQSTISDEQLIELIKNEVNVKEVLFDVGATSANEAELDTVITEELKKEGQMRELVRGIQDLRKKAELTPSDSIVLTISTTLEGEGLVGLFEEQIKKIVLAKDVVFAEETEGAEIKVDDILFSVSIGK